MILLLAMLGCRPEPAPETLEELCGFVFAHFNDEDSRSLEEAVDNLDAWMLENEGLIGEDGYEVETLPQEVLESLNDERLHSNEGLVGAAVSDPVGHDNVAIAPALLLEDQAEVFDGVYADYERTYNSDPDCFVTEECVGAEVENRILATYVGLIDVESHVRGQFRWVDSDIGTTLLQRTWLIGETQVSVDWVDVTEQFFMGLTLPREDGVVRIQAIWIAGQLGDDPAPEGLVLSSMVSSMRDQSVLLDDWLTEN